MDTVAVAKRHLISDNAAAKVAAAKMPIDFYYMPPSPPCRAVMLVAKMVGVELNAKMCNIMQGEHKTEEYTKMNPQQTIPTIDDNGYILWESRPIMAYLVNQYAKDDSLYPKDPKHRAVVDQRLYFDMGTMFKKMADYFYPVIFAGAPSPIEEKLEPLEDALKLLDTFLQTNKYVAGNAITIADITLVVTISNIDAFGHDLSAYPNLSAWYKTVQTDLTPFGYQEINQAGANAMAGFYKSKLR